MQLSASSCPWARKPRRWTSLPTRCIQTVLTSVRKASWRGEGGLNDVFNEEISENGGHGTPGTSRASNHGGQTGSGGGSPEGIEVSTPLLLGQKDGDDDDAKYPRVSAGITLFSFYA